MDPVPFEIQQEQLAGGVRALSVRGELDMNTAPILKEELDEITTENAKVVLDLAGCEFIDSTGIALIVRAWQRLDGNGDGKGRMVLCSINHQVQRLLSITGIDDSISTFEQRESAVAAISS